MSRVGLGEIIGKWDYRQGLASGVYRTLSGTLDSSAWVDEGYGSGVEIPPFITCAFDATSGKVVPFDNGTHDSADVYLLQPRVYEIEKGDQLVALFDQVVVKYGYVTETSAVTWADVQRLEIRPEEV